MLELLKSFLLQDGILSEINLIKAKAEEVFNTYNLLSILTKNQIQDLNRFIQGTNNPNEVKTYLDNKKRRDKGKTSWGKEVCGKALADKIWEVIDSFETNAEIQARFATSANPSLGINFDQFKNSFWIQFSKEFVNYLLGLYQIDLIEEKGVKE